MLRNTLAELLKLSAKERAEIAMALIGNPLIYPHVHGDTRRALVQRFPYAVYFRPIAGEVVVLAVMHGRRLPRRWQSRR